jgi:hypothetical protein
MTMKRLLVSSMLAIMCVAAAHAQAALTGKWQGETKSGAMVVLDLTSTKTALTGTLTYDGQPSKIAEGVVSKNTFTFKAMIEGQTEGFTGELAGDQITFWPDRIGRERATILKRVKAKG